MTGANYVNSLKGWLTTMQTNEMGVYHIGITSPSGFVDYARRYCATFEAAVLEATLLRKEWDGVCIACVERRPDEDFMYEVAEDETD